MFTPMYTTAPPTSTLSHINPVHILLPHFNILLSPSPRPPNGLVFLLFRPTFHSMSRLSYACCIPRPSLSKNIQKKFKILQSSPCAVLLASYHFFLHRSKFFPQHVAQKHPQIILYSQCYSPRYIKQVQLHFLRILVDCRN